MKNWGTGVEELPIRDGVSYFGPDTVLLGGLDGGTILSTAATRSRCSRRCATFSHMGDTPFILGADCTVPNTIDPDHIRWVMEAQAGH